MRRLILFRHGKSDWDADFRSDHERPLNGRGARSARLMGKLMARTGELPTLVVASTAVRATTTAELAIKAGNWDVEFHQDHALYAASPSSMLEYIRQLPDQHGSIMLVGHEPVWSGLVSAFTGANARVPTAAMVGMRFSAARWVDVRFDGGELLWLLKPRLFEYFPL
ncbi:SixA phosphatase family protein [Thiolapillus brandeum]|uniref:Phosphohistidine phosphatase n=1 Tax=Thiolapillus brandeum TaxID=1076588 RepID=A0A7U6GHD8_9GAMM|nr:histidine phosphatase family protein [Thiolapillus brandeum]BAO43633.1 phosphohistidine phosphatase [Thiolapillus brandeum]